MKKTTKTKFLRTAVSALFLLMLVGIIALIIMAVLPDFINVIESGNEARIEEYILSFGSLEGALLASILQFVQIMSIIFPGAPIQIAIGVIFGSIKGLIICQIGYLSAYAVVFSVTRHLGKRLNDFFDTEESSQKGIFKFMYTAAHPEIMVMIACLIPIMPNGLVPYVAGKSKITLKRFMLFSYAGSFPTLLLLCSIGNNLIKGDYLTAAVYTLVMGLFIIYFLLRKDKIYNLYAKISAYFSQLNDKHSNKIEK